MTSQRATTDLISGSTGLTKVVMSHSLNIRTQNTSLRNPVAPTIRRSEGDSTNPIHTSNTHLGSNTETRIPKPDSSKDSTESKASAKSDDDFDVNEYFARLQGTRYVSAPINAVIEDKNANLEEAEENLEEINLLEDSRSNPSPSYQQSLTADIAQNFSQLPQVLPQVANAVFSSFSNYLNLNRSREDTPVPVSDYAQNQGNRGNQDNSIGVQGQAQNIGYDPHNVQMCAPDLGLKPPSIEDKPPVAVGPPPVGGAANTFRMTSRKKTYAHIPGLSTGGSHISPISPFSTPPNPHANVATPQTGFLTPSVDSHTTTSSIFAPPSMDADLQPKNVLGFESFQSPPTHAKTAQTNTGFLNPLDGNKNPEPKNTTGPESSAVMMEMSENQLKDVLPTEKNLSVNVSGFGSVSHGDTHFTTSQSQTEIVEKSIATEAGERHEFTPLANSDETQFYGKTATYSMNIDSNYQHGYLTSAGLSIERVPSLGNVPPSSTELSFGRQLPPGGLLSATRTPQTENLINNASTLLPQPGIFPSSLQSDLSSGDVPFSGILSPLDMLQPVTNSNIYINSPPVGDSPLSVPSSNLPPNMQQTSLPLPPKTFPPTGSIPPRSSLINRGILPPSLARKVAGSQPSKSVSIAESNIYVPRPPSTNIDSTAISTLDSAASITANAGTSQIFTPSFTPENDVVETTPASLFNLSSVGTSVRQPPILERASPTNTASAFSFGPPVPIKPLELCNSFIGQSVQQILPAAQDMPKSETYIPGTPSIFDPCTYGQDTIISHQEMLSSNISHSSIMKPPQETSKPPIEPPKIVPGGQNFRLGNKKRPQYYSGPIEGTGHIGNMIKPTLEPVMQPSSSDLSNLSFFTPNVDLSSSQNQNHSGKPFDIGQSQGNELQSNIQPSIGQNQQQTYGQTQSQSVDTSFDLSRRQGETYPTQTVGYSSSGFDIDQTYPGDYEREAQKDESNLFGSLKTKLSSVNINRLQNVVTSFFDPTYYDAEKKEITYDHRTTNLSYGPPSTEYEQNQAFNLEISVPSLESNTKYGQPQIYDTPYHYPVGHEHHTHQHVDNQQTFSQYGHQDYHAYGNYNQSHLPTSEGYQNPCEQYQSLHNYSTYDPTGFNLDKPAENMQPIISGNTITTNVWAPTGKEETYTEYSTVISQESSTGTASSTTQISKITAGLDQLSSENILSPKDSQIEETENVLKPNNDKELKGTSSLNFFTQPTTDFFESGDSDNFTIIRSEISTEAKIQTLKEVDCEIQANKDDHRNSNDKDFKNNDENASAITTQMIENMISPMQLFNPVEEPLKESTTHITYNMNEDSNQFQEISQITEETMETIQEQASNELFDQENENDNINNNESNIYFDEAYGNYEWSMKAEDKVIEEQQTIPDYYRGQQADEKIGCKDDPLNIPKNASDEIKAELQHVSQDDVFLGPKNRFLPRQMSIPTAPPAEDVIETQEVADVRAGLDLNLIEQDAKKDFPHLLDAYVVQAETDDGKLEKEKYDDPPLTKIEYVSKGIDNVNFTSSFRKEDSDKEIAQPIHKFNAAPGSPVYENVKDSTSKISKITNQFDIPAVGLFNLSLKDPLYDNVQNIIESQVKEETVSHTEHIQSDQCNIETTSPIYENVQKVVSPLVSFASYFDTGNYAADNYFKNAQYKFEHKEPTLPTFETSNDSIDIANIQSHDQFHISDTVEQYFIIPDLHNRDDHTGILGHVLKEEINENLEQKFKAATTNTFDVMPKNITEIPLESNYVHESYLQSQNQVSNIENAYKCSDPKKNMYDTATSSTEIPKTEESHKEEPAASSFFGNQDAKQNLPVMSDPLHFFSSPEPEQETNKDPSFNLLASYFTTPATRKTHKPDPQRSFFELSEGQDHYMHPSHNPVNEIKVVNQKSHLWRHGKELLHKSFQTSVDESDLNYEYFVTDTISCNSKLNNELNKSDERKMKKESNIPRASIKYNINVYKGESNLNNLTVSANINAKITEKAEHIEKFLISDESKSQIDEDYDSILVAFIRNHLNQCIESVIKENRTVETENVGLEIFLEHNTDEPMDADGKTKGKEDSVHLPTKDSNKESSSHKPKVTFSTEEENGEDMIDGNGANKDDAEEEQYRPVQRHWFYRMDRENRSVWKPFTRPDSDAIEAAYGSPGLKEITVVATDGGRYDVRVMDRTRAPVYWTGTPTNVRRCSWFYKGASDARYIPYTEAVADMLEEEYRTAFETGEWERRVTLPEGEKLMLHSRAHIVHYPVEASLLGKRVYRGLPPKLGLPKTGTKKIDHLILMVHGVGCHRKFLLNAASAARPRLVRRGADEAGIEDAEPSKVDHLLLLCHGIGSTCDIKFRPVEEVVDDFRSMSQLLTQSHYKNSCEQETVGRVEVLPVSWHSSLHSGKNGVDSRLSAITLESCPRLRGFTNDTILDVLFYTSPLYCQTILNTVGQELERIYKLFKSRNPGFSGGVSLGGHSLGSLILFDLLCHQRLPPGQHTEDVMRRVKYAPGVNGPVAHIKYPQLSFQPRALYALGSPIAIFLCVRGVDSLGEKFALPTCPGFFNIFHPFDPIAYRVEPLVNAELKGVPPLLIPHHKGRKRMHLELKDTMARVGENLKGRLLESVLKTWNSVFRGAPHPPPPTDDQLEKAIQEQLAREEEEPSVSATPEPSSTKTVRNFGKLNSGRRVDHVLQEAPIETINEYLFAVTSHLCYWESEDTMLLILREIYSELGIEPDTTVPQQTMTVEVQRPGKTSRKASNDRASSSRSEQ